MKVSISLLLGLLLFTAGELYASDSILERRKELEQAIKNNDWMLAESLSNKELELVPEEDSLERASAWLQHGAILYRSGKYNQGHAEQELSMQIIKRYFSKKREVTDAELDFRAAMLKSYEKERGIQPCDYLQPLTRQIKRNWFPPRNCTGYNWPVKVQFKIHKNGRLSDLRVTGSGGTITADCAALKAVTDASPFRPLPDEVPESVEIEFTFDYKLFTGENPGARQLTRKLGPSSKTLMLSCD